MREPRDPTGVLYYPFLISPVIVVIVDLDMLYIAGAYALSVG
jgi:hypothetical protein